MLCPLVGRLVGMASTVGERIREVRKGLGLKPAEFARKIGVKPPSVSQLESGDSKAPAAETLLRMRDVGINPDYIMRGKGPKFLSPEEIEQTLRKQTLWSMLDELDADETGVVEDVVKGIIRRKKGSSPNDPFKKDAPGEEGIQ